MQNLIVWERPLTLDAIRAAAAMGWGDLEPEEGAAIFDAEPLQLFRAYAHGHAEATEFVARHSKALTPDSERALRAFLRGELLDRSREADALRKHFVPTIPEEALIEGTERGPPERGVLDRTWALAQIEGRASHPLPPTVAAAHRARKSSYASTVVRPQIAYTGGPHREPLELTSHCVWLDDAIPLYVYTQRQVPVDEARILSKSGRRQHSGLLDPMSCAAIVQAFWPERAAPNAPGDA